MPPGDVIIIGPGPKVQSNMNTEDAIALMRKTADALESGEMDAAPMEDTE